MGDPNRSGGERPAEPPPPAAGPDETADPGETAVGGWVIPGNVGSLDDVPAGTAGLPAAEEEPPDG